MANNAFLVDGNWCYGCHSCEVACQEEKKFPEDDQMGIQVVKMGVWNYMDGEEEKWQNTFLALPTDQCDGCEGRLKDGKQPLCSTVCPAQALTLGDFEELSKRVENPRQLVIRIS